MHFFIETTNLQPQAATNKFGVVSSTIYNVASKFNLGTATKAFAPVKGQIIVQQSTDANLVNVILKPMEAVKTNIAPVKYFVFRGIEKSSFIQGTDEIVPTGSELIQRFWTDYNNWLSKLTTPPPTPKVDVFGYDQNTITNTESIRSIFMNGHDVRPFVVQEGMWIGDFAAGATAGFEIILAESSYIPTLAYARATEHKVEITTQTGFEEKKKREEILNFIDPAAFYGLFYKTGVKINGTNTKVKKEQLYTDILEKFHTKNTIYLDIRNEEGYSYNFFENYSNGGGDNIEVNINGNGFVPQVYENNWPILAITPTGTTNNTETDIEIKLRTDDNPEPLIYHPDLVTTPDKKYGQFIGTDAIMNVSSVWSKALFFKAFNRENGNAFQNVATYNRINYFRKVAYEGDNLRVPKKTEFHHGLFGSIHHAEINQANHYSNHVTLGGQKLITKTLDNKKINQLVIPYTVWSDDVIIFGVGEQDINRRDFLISHFPSIFSAVRINFPKKIPYFTNAKYRVIPIRNDDISDLDVLEIVPQGFPYLYSNSFIGITKAELELLRIEAKKVIDDITCIKLKNETELISNDGVKYYKYDVFLSGYDANGDYVAVPFFVNNSAVNVFSINKNIFTSKDFMNDCAMKVDYSMITPVSEKGKLYLYSDYNDDGSIIFNENEMKKIQGYTTKILQKNGIDYIIPTLTTKETFSEDMLTPYDSLIILKNTISGITSNINVGRSIGVDKSTLITEVGKDNESEYDEPFVSVNGTKEALKAAYFQNNALRGADILYVIAFYTCHEIWHQYLNKAEYFWHDFEFALVEDRLYSNANGSKFFYDEGHTDYENIINLNSAGTNLVPNTPTGISDKLLDPERILPYQELAVRGFFVYHYLLRRYEYYPTLGGTGLITTFNSILNGITVTLPMIDHSVTTNVSIEDWCKAWTKKVRFNEERLPYKNLIHKMMFPNGKETKFEGLVIFKIGEENLAKTKELPIDYC